MRVGIVGGGIVGLFTAYYLLRKGAEIEILDANLSGRASENNAGFIVSSASKPELSLPMLAKALLGSQTSVRVSSTRLLRKPGWFLKAVRSYSFGDDIIAQMIRVSLDLYYEFFSREKMEVDLVKGSILAYKSWEEAVAAARGVNGRLLNEGDLKELGYKELGGGVYIEERLSINPVKLYWNLRKLVEELGGKIINSEVRRIRISDKTCSAITGDGHVYDYDYVVISAGSRSTEVCKSIGYDPMIEPARGVVMLYKVKGDIVKAPALLEGYHVAIAQHGSEVLRVTGLFELLGHKTRVSKSSIEWLKSIVSRHVRNYKDAVLSSIEVGFRPCSADLLPVIGRIPGTECTYIATGLCRLGITMAPVAGKIVSSMILGEDPHVHREVLIAISPERFGKAKIHK